MVSFARGGHLAAVGLFCLLVIGCKSSNVVAVSGRLTYKGKPVPDAYVHFVPEKGRPSMGETNSDGNFVLTYDPQTKGAELGTHKVWIQRNPLAASGSGGLPGAPAALPADVQAFFEKYSGTNSKIEVKIDKANRDLKLDLD